MLLVSTNVTVSTMDDALGQFTAVLMRQGSKVVYSWGMDSCEVPCIGTLEIFEPSDFHARKPLPHED